MASPQDTLLDLERQRLQLEENIAQLRKALQHWQTWDAEYEALKEEVEAASEVSDRDQELQRIHDGFEGELLRGKELDEIFGHQGSRSGDQIVNVLQRRIDYVGKNVQSLQKQLDTAEDKLADALEASQPEAMDDSAEPITEILEELDDDDNVLSYRLNRPGDSMSHIQKALENAGVTDLTNDKPEQKEDGAEVTSAVHEPQQENAQPTSQVRNGEAQSYRPSSPKKTVSFVEDVDVVEVPSSAPTPPQEMSRTAKRVESIMKTAKEQENISKQDPIIPDDEAPEDAELRQQMLKYSMGEVGAVVAELELEEPDEADYESGYDDTDDDDDDGEDDGEDQYGRSTGRIVTEDYRRRMLELEKKLGIKSHQSQTLESRGTDSDSEGDEGIGRIIVKRNQESPPSASKPAPLKSSLKDKHNDADSKKGVRFAQSLDVAPDDVDSMPSIKERDEPLVEPLSDIVERASPASASTPVVEPNTSRKPSRFKKTMDSATSSGEIPKGPLDVPSRLVDEDTNVTRAYGPAGATLADTLVERQPRSAPQAPGELDESLDYNAVAGEYHALRKKFIQRQGGFLQEDTSPIQEIVDDEEAAEPISRFKAARLSRQ